MSSDERRPALNGAIVKREMNLRHRLRRGGFLRRIADLVTLRWHREVDPSSDETKEEIMEDTTDESTEESNERSTETRSSIEFETDSPVESEPWTSISTVVTMVEFSDDDSSLPSDIRSPYLPRDHEPCFSSTTFTPERKSVTLHAPHRPPPLTPPTLDPPHGQPCVW
eukprot:CAMPEP_0184687042 /NCGR_PEP_ID=MMETSP0312-20130426/24951_1 /TAXON_ID=31354 /ORGANISM="Compsopogon coeruleus, Strain SAG 36.94" /LENGTH=167 /DNA_ID=CAMNT_0027142747 /DNA_START=861 /DNA_END=1361 /DNA_ORIENTATION=+